MFSCRRRGIGGKPHVTDGNRRTRVREKVSRAIPAPEANAELQTNLNVCRIILFYPYDSIVILHVSCSCIKKVQEEKKGNIWVGFTAMLGI